MRIAIRADASLKIGAGHVFRCKTLADELCERGAHVMFVCRDLPGSLVVLLRETGYRTVALPAHLKLASDQSIVPLADAAVQCQLEDARQTIEALKEFQADWLIVDHYHLDVRWETFLRPYANRLLVIDDLADRKHDCDVLLDPTYGGSDERYRGYLNPEAHCLCGSQYALLRAQFLLHRPSLPRNLPVMEKMRVHVFFGSADLSGHTLRFSALLLENFAGLQVCAVVGREYASLDQLQRLSGEYEGRFSWQKDVHDMAASMIDCDVAVGAPGGATWERASLGLPSAYLAVSQSHETVLEHLDSNGLCRYLGQADQIPDCNFVEGMRDFLGNAECLASMSERGMSAVDAKGVLRVADVLEKRL